MVEFTHVADSPLGRLLLVASATGLRRVGFSAGKRTRSGSPDNEHLAAATRQLEEYFAGTRQAFDLSLEPAGTPFQLLSWKVLCGIPFGSTITYADQAKAMGKPRAVRAVGGANGRNPLAIIVPCHRVIGAGGELTGYAGGLDRKSWLLEHENN